jgi:hypothetical protein
LSGEKVLKIDLPGSGGDGIAETHEQAGAAEH